MACLNKQQRTFRIPVSELSADAPIAAVDCDGSSNESKGIDLDPTGVRVFSEENLAGSFCSLDFEAPLHGSLTDLVLNFEDRIRSTEHISDAKNISLLQVKMWWNEAAGDISVSDYPLAALPNKIGPYDELEPMDADGMTEDSEPDQTNHTIDHRLHCHVPNSATSSQGHVTTDSESLSPDSPQVSIPTATYLNEMPPSGNSYFYVHELSRDTLDFSHATITPSSDLMHFSMKRLRLHIDGLNSSILLKSDQLVQLLTERDEQLMLREASDDFVILLCLVHQRRARASRAALKSAAWSMIRPKGVSRSRISWFSRRSIPERSNTHSVSPDNSSDCDTYVKSLHLDSKRRLPVAHPIALRGPRFSPLASGPCSDQNPTDPSSMTTHSSWQPSSDSAKMRLVELRNRCAAMGWPNNQPELSLALALHLPFNAGHGRTLSKLRIINQILYCALLELPDTKPLIEKYWNETYRAQETSSWIAR